MPDTGTLLTSKEVARFVAHGYLQFDDIVPDGINEAAVKQFEAGVGKPVHDGTVDDVYPEGTALGDLLRLSRVRGALYSLLGPGAVVHNHSVHLREANEAKAQPLHADQIADIRPERDPYSTFDVTLMYYPQAVSLEMGGTLFIPGSHLRRIRGADIGRYQNLRGQVRLVCPKGTVLMLHHGIWHCGRENVSERDRYMFRTRLHAAGEQVRWWDTSDLLDPEIPGILMERFDWYEMMSARLEFANRIRLWQSISGTAGR